MRVLTGEEKFYCDLCGTDITKLLYPEYPKFQVEVSRVTLNDGIVHFTGQVGFDRMGKHVCLQCSKVVIRAVAQLVLDSR